MSSARDERTLAFDVTLPLSQKAKPPSFALSEIDEDCVQATAFGVVFMIWRRRTTAEAFNRGVVLARRYSEQLRSKIGCCQVVEVDAVPPDMEARKAFGEWLNVDFVARSVVIHDGNGFKAASVRAIVNLQLLVAKPRFPHALFHNASMAVASLASDPGTLARGGSAPVLDSVLSELRALHRARFP